MGISGYIEKPIQTDKLLTMIENLITSDQQHHFKEIKV